MSSSDKDSYETPKEVLEEVLANVSRSQRLYDPFYCNGASERHFASLGFKFTPCAVKNCSRKFSDGKCPCMQVPSGVDLVVTNPPFSCLEEVLPWLASLDIPVLVLVPSTAVFQPWCMNLLQGLVEIPAFSAEVVTDGFVKDGVQLPPPSFHCWWIFLRSSKVKFVDAEGAFVDSEESDMEFSDSDYEEQFEDCGEGCVEGDY